MSWNGKQLQVDNDFKLNYVESTYHACYQEQDFTYTFRLF